MSFLDYYRERRCLPDDVSDREALGRLLVERDRIPDVLQIDLGILTRIKGDTKVAMIASISALLTTIVDNDPSAELEGVSEAFLEEYDIVREENFSVRLMILLALLEEEDDDDDDDDPGPRLKRAGIPFDSFQDSDGGSMLLAA